MSHPNSKSKTSLATLFPFSMRDLIVTALILFVAVAFCILLQRLDPSAGSGRSFLQLCCFLLAFWRDLGIFIGWRGKFIRRRTKRTGNEKFFQKDR